MKRDSLPNPEPLERIEVPSREMAEAHQKALAAAVSDQPGFRAAVEQRNRANGEVSLDAAQLSPSALAGATPGDAAHTEAVRVAPSTDAPLVGSTDPDVLTPKGRKTHAQHSARAELRTAPSLQRVLAESPGSPVEQPSSPVEQPGAPASAPSLEAPPKRRRWPLWALLLLVVGTGVGLYLASIEPPDPEISDAPSTAAVEAPTDTTAGATTGTTTSTTALEPSVVDTAPAPSVTSTSSSAASTAATPSTARPPTTVMTPSAKPSAKPTATGDVWFP